MIIFLWDMFYNVQNTMQYAPSESIDVKVEYFVTITDSFSHETITNTMNAKDFQLSNQLTLGLAPYVLVLIIKRLTFMKSFKFIFHLSLTLVRVGKENNGFPSVPYKPQTKHS